MKKIMRLYYIVSAIVALTVCFIMDVKKIKDFLKGIACAAIATSLVIILGKEFGWSDNKILAGVVIVSCYARPVLYGINTQIKEFFRDPKAFLDKYKGN